MFRDGWITVNSVPTHVATYGGWIEDKIPGDYVVLAITGNPGIIDFYYLFLETLYKIIGVPTWVVSHAGNEPVPKGLKTPSMDRHPELYDLEGQIKHKRSFIEEYIPPGKKIILIGHSVGGKISVELLKDKEISPRVAQAHLVCPALQKIAQSYNGRAFVNVIQHIIPIIVALSWIFYILPMSVRRAILSTYMSFRSDWKKCEKESCLLGIVKLFTPQVSKASLRLAKDEMEKIGDLDSEVYENNYDKIHCYYAPEDNWAPVEQYHDLMGKHPKINGTLLDGKFTHAFVLTAPSEMAEELAKNISPILKN